jgi:hypothetical protein
VIATFALALASAAPASYPLRLIRSPEDEEIVWATQARETFWVYVVRRAAREEAVLTRLDHRGLPSLCRELEEQRGRLVARYAGPFNEMIVADVRRNIDAATLDDAIEHADSTANPWLLQSDVQGWKTRAAAANAAFIGGAAGDLARRFAKWNEGEGDVHIGARLKPEALARLRREPDELAFWCQLPEPTRERAVGGYLKGDE